MIQDLRKVFLDECGYTGSNLLDESQPFQSAAALEISEEHAAALISEHFPKHRGPELKYRQLVRREGYWDGLIALQNILLKSAPCHSYVVDKRFVLIEKFLEHCVEPFYRAGGVDFYADGCLEQAASLIYHCGPVFYGKEKLDAFLILFQKVCRNREPEDLKFLVKLAADFSAIEMEEFFGPLGTNHPAASVELMAKGTNTDAAYPLVMGLISLCEQRGGEYEIIHDQSENLKLYTEEFQNLIDVKLTRSFKMSNVCQITFPLKLQRVSQVDSKASSAVQLADILAGGAVDMVKGKTTHREKENPYFNELERIYSEAPEEAFIFQFPTIDLEEIRDRRKGNESNDFITFGVDNIKK